MKNRCVRTILAVTFATALAHAGDITVPGVSDIWLAGQPGGTLLTGSFGTDTALTNSPVLLDVFGGETLMFSVSGSTSVDGSCFAGADGGCYPNEFSYGTGPVNGIGDYTGPSDALIGVFLDNSLPSGVGGPASLDFTGANNFASLSPLLNQIFFIGDGLTGTGSGAEQQFTAPAGATRLFLSVADSVGGSQNNVGSLTVDVITPEPSAFAPGVLACLAMLRVARKRRASRG